MMHTYTYNILYVSDLYRTLVYICPVNRNKYGYNRYNTFSPSYCRAVY